MFFVPSPFQIRLKATIAVLGLAIAVSACARRQDVTGSIIPPDDYRERHPIILANAPRKLEIYALRGVNGLDQRQSDDVKAFAVEYKSAGQGIIRIELPDGAAARASQESLHNIRRDLQSLGISERYLNIRYYHPEDPASAAPVRLSFLRLQAKVDSHCGQWYTDINGASTSANFRNQSPANFGCAYQSSLAAQVANPVDLVRPRQEGPYDVLKRAKDIEDLRQHKDPSTQWRTNAQTVGTQGGN